MISLLQFWIIRIDFTTIITFVVGALVGAMLLCLAYALFVVMTLRDKKYQTKLQANDLSAKEAEEMIHIAQEAFKSKDLRGDSTKMQHFKSISHDLVYGIASRFYPNSKRPLFELSIDEGIELIGYVQKRLDEILSNRVLKIFRRYSFSNILGLTQATTAVVDSKAFEVTKTVSKGYQIGKKIVKSVLDPSWIVRKFTTDIAVSVIMNKLYLTTIGIIGEEAYKIYSKSYKNSYEEIDSGVLDMVESIDSELKEELKKDENEEDSKVEVSNKNTVKLKQKIYINNKNYEDDNYKSSFDSSKTLMRRDTQA